MTPMPNTPDKPNPYEPPRSFGSDENDVATARYLKRAQQDATIRFFERLTLAVKIVVALIVCFVLIWLLSAMVWILQIEWR